jgi:transcriptional regulator with GAF, ATPase, and Fis domain
MDAVAVKEILDSLDANVAVVDRQGVIRYVNESWIRFARENGDPDLSGTGLGVNYLGVCRAAARDEPAIEGLVEALERVVNGSLEEYKMEYPCHSPEKKRWFLLGARPLKGGSGGGVFIHFEITEKKLAEEAIKNINEELERKVEARTLSLKEANMKLREALLQIADLKEKLERENLVLRESIKSEQDYHGIIGQSHAIRDVLAKVRQVAPTDAPVLIMGETGTGKELVARAIHDMSPRRDKVFVKVNCASLPSQLIESELFGHEKGAYTHAYVRRIGRFEMAEGSSLFLDEIGELPFGLQAKLLRVLQEGEFERVGSSNTIKVDVRVIAATNRRLEEEVKTGRFREDLWYRLNVFPITVPPLRDRKEDVQALIRHFLERYNKRLGKHIDSIPAKSMEAVLNYPWPGNVRELENYVHRAVIVSQGRELLLDLPDCAMPESKPQGSLEEVERRHIRDVLDACAWRIEGKGGAAELLQMHPSTLRSRMKKLGIRRSS